MAGGAGELEWAMEGLVQFLTSPVWKCHVEDFIDQNCLIFDTEEENKFSYTDVHNEYKTVVENILQRFFLQELDVSLQQLLTACSDGIADSSQYKELFQPLLAVNDFLLFKSIMVQRNVLLNKEAENAFQKSQKSKMQYLEEEELYSKEQKPDQSSPDEDKLLADVLLQSRLEYERSIEEEEREFQKLIRQATEESLKCYEMEIKSLSLQDQKQATTTSETDTLSANDELNLVNDTTSDQEHVHVTSTAIDTEITRTSKVTPSVQVTPLLSSTSTQRDDTDHLLPAVSSTTVKDSNTAESWLATARAEAAATADQVQVDTCQSKSSKQRNGELLKREDYLKKQRDSILAKKRKEREMELQLFLKNNPSTDHSMPANLTLPVHVEDKPSPTAATEPETGSSKLRQVKKKSSQPVLTPAVADKVNQE